MAVGMVGSKMNHFVTAAKEPILPLKTRLLTLTYLLCQLGLISSEPLDIIIIRIIFLQPYSPHCWKSALWHSHWKEPHVNLTLCCWTMMSCTRMKLHKICSKVYRSAISWQRKGKTRRSSKNIFRIIMNDSLVIKPAEKYKPIYYHTIETEKVINVILYQTLNVFIGHFWYITNLMEFETGTPIEISGGRNSKWYEIFLLCQFQMLSCFTLILRPNHIFVKALFLSRWSTVFGSYNLLLYFLFFWEKNRKITILFTVQKWLNILKILLFLLFIVNSAETTQNLAKNSQITYRELLVMIIHQFYQNLLRSKHLVSTHITHT